MPTFKDLEACVQEACESIANKVDTSPMFGTGGITCSDDVLKLIEQGKSIDFDYDRLMSDLNNC